MLLFFIIIDFNYIGKKSWNIPQNIFSVSQKK